MSHRVLSLTLPVLMLIAAGPVWAQSDPPAVVDVRSSVDCPSAAAVRAALAGLVAAAPTDSQGPDVADVGRDLRSDGDKTVVVRLRTAGGTFVAEKPLAAGLSCDERADAVAVIVAAWEARLQSGERTSLPLPSSEPPAAVRGPAPVAAAAPPPPAPVLAPPPAPVDNLTANPLPPPSPERAAAEWKLLPGAGLLGSFQGNDLRPGLVVEAILTKAASPYAVGVGGLWVGGHEATLSAGQGAWWRLGATLDGRRAFRFDAADVEARLAVALARLEVEGRAFPSTGYDILTDPGLMVGVRLLPKSRQALCPWLDLGLAYWPRTHVLTVSGTDRSLSLPHLELLLGVGLSFGRRG